MKLSFQNGILVLVVTLVHVIAISMLSVSPEAANEAISEQTIPAATENVLTLAADSAELAADTAEASDTAGVPAENSAPADDFFDQPALPRIMKPLPGS